MGVEDLDVIWDGLSRLNMPVKGVHIGNFVGISLCYFASRLKEVCSDSLIIAIDPNIPHRGIQRPDDITAKVLRKFRVENMVLRLTGYSIKKCLSNDSINYTGDYDPYTHFQDEVSSQYQLLNLLKIGRSWLDFAIIDGNHEGEYLSKEIMVSYALLRNGGHLYIDDLDEDWPQIKKVYEYISESEMFSTSKIGCRTGLLIKQECPTLHSAPVSRTLGI